MDVRNSILNAKSMKQVAAPKKEPELAGKHGYSKEVSLTSAS